MSWPRFVAPTNGLYPFRLLYYQGQGGADCEFYAFDFDKGGRVLINDPANLNSIKAYLVPAVTPRPTIVNVRRSGGNFSFDFQSVAGKIYAVEYEDALTDPGTWTFLQDISGDGTLKTASYSTSSPSKRFYRLRLH